MLIETMVTTIKITCDGVFIQYNPYLNNINAPKFQSPQCSSQNVISSALNSQKNNMESAIQNLDHEYHLMKFSEVTTNCKINRSASCLSHKEFLLRSHNKQLSTFHRFKNFLNHKLHFNNNTLVDQSYSHCYEMNPDQHRDHHHHHHHHTTNNSRLLGIFFGAGTDRKCSKTQNTLHIQRKFYTSCSRHRKCSENQSSRNNYLGNFTATISTVGKFINLSNSDQKHTKPHASHKQVKVNNNSFKPSPLQSSMQPSRFTQRKSSLTTLESLVFNKSFVHCNPTGLSSFTDNLITTTNEPIDNTFSQQPPVPVGSLKTRFLQRSHSTNATCFSSNYTNNVAFRCEQFNVGHLNATINDSVEKLQQSTNNFDVDLSRKITKRQSFRCRPALAAPLQETDSRNNNNFKQIALTLSKESISSSKIEGEPVIAGKHQKRHKESYLKAGSRMNSHATATQALNLQSSAGQTSVVGHHRGFSQPSGSGAVSSAGDPWFLQSTGHQIPPTAPARHNKRPAPQPVSAVGAGLSSGVAVGGIGSSLLQQQQQHTQSQPHIVPPSIPPHQGNVNQQHINSNHLSSHVLNSHNLSSSNHTPKSPNQQQTIVQQHINPLPHTLATPSSSICQAGQLLSNSSNNNIMSSSLNSGQLQNHFVSGKIHSSSVAGNSSGLIIQPVQQQHQPLSLSSNQCPSSIHVPITTNVMSTSLHNFDSNGTAWNSTSSISPTISNASSTSSTNHQMQHVQQSIHNLQHLQPIMPLRKCEVKLNAMPWFHGSISRDEAEHLLQPRDDGLFLVRESTNFPGDYTLCVCYQGKVEHYRVKYLENKLTIDDEEYFENLGQLVSHYEKDADGLCTQLIKCLPKKGKQEYCINSKDFADKGWVIPENDLQLRESIGKGEFGDVMLGILRNDRVAVKMLKDDGAAQKFLAEASVMTTLEHENLVKFIGLVFTTKHIYLVTEYMSKGSLVDYLRSRGRQHVTKKDQINFAYDTCSGMEYLEAKKVVHRDLAARNVLISENCTAKVSDFGLAREECYNLEVGKLPIKWTAPEALKGGRFSNKSDMWSFGILLWEIYSFGRVPYPRIPLADVVKHVEVGYKMEAPEGCPAEIYEMMRQAWDLNPIKRPTFSELKVKLVQFKNTTT